MKVILLVVLLSSGLNRAEFSSERECLEHMLEYQIMAQNDLWSAVCVDEEAMPIDGGVTLEGSP